MCFVSYVSDYESKRWDDRFGPQWQQWTFTNPAVTRAEFDALKREVEELRALLKAAIKFDENTDQPHCEADDKIAKLRKMAEIVGVDMDDVLGKLNQKDD